MDPDCEIVEKPEPEKEIVVINDTDKSEPAPSDSGVKLEVDVIAPPVKLEVDVVPPPDVVPPRVKMEPVNDPCATPPRAPMKKSPPAVRSAKKRSWGNTSGNPGHSDAADLCIGVKEVRIILVP